MKNIGKKEYEAVMFSKCVECGHLQDVRKGEEAMCKECLGPLIAVSVEMRKIYD
jgi:hypothetical protein